MSLKYEKHGVKLYQGDCLDNLKLIRSNSIDAIVTDPPAGIAFMSKDWDKDKGGRDGWVCWMTEIMVECKRVLKPNGKMLVWAIPRTSHWTAKAIVDSGLYLKGKQYFVFGSGFPKSHNISKAVDKKFGVEREKTGVLVRGGSRKARRGEELVGSSTVESEKWKEVTLPATDEAKRWDGWGTALKPSVEEWIYATKNENTEEYSGFYYGSKAQRKDRNEGCEVLNNKDREPRGNNQGTRVCKTCGKTDNGINKHNNCVGEYEYKLCKPIKNTHPTVKSVDLMSYLCGEVANKDAVILDPFMGSGSTGKACVKEGYHFIGIEKEEEYFEIAKVRINYELEKPVQVKLW